MTIMERMQAGASVVTAKAVTFYSAGLSGLASVVTWIVAETPDAAGSAVALGAGSLTLGGFALATHIVTKAVEYRKNDRAAAIEEERNRQQFELEKLRIEKEDANSARIQELESKRAYDKDRARQDRDYMTANIAGVQNKLDEANAKLRKFKQGQQVNGEAIAEIGRQTGIEVVPSIPPDDSGDHPVLP